MLQQSFFFQLEGVRTLRPATLLGTVNRTFTKAFRLEPTSNPCPVWIARDSRLGTLDCHSDTSAGIGPTRMHGHLSGAPEARLIRKLSVAT